MTDARVWDLLDVQNALERLAPRAGNVRERDDSESASSSRLIDVDSFWFHFAPQANLVRAASRKLFLYDEINARRFVMKIKPIQTDSDHERALLEIQTLWGAEEGTADGDRLDVLITLVDAYENEHFPMG